MWKVSTGNAWELEFGFVSVGLPNIFHNHARRISLRGLCLLFLWKGDATCWGGVEHWTLTTACLGNVATFAPSALIPIKKGQIWVQMSDGFYGWQYIKSPMKESLALCPNAGFGDYSLKYNKQHIWQIWFLKMSSELPHVLPPSSIVIIHQLETSAVLCIIQTVRIVKKKMENLTNCVVGPLESFHMQSNPDQLLVSDKLPPSASCGCASVSWARFPNHYFW